MNRTGALLLSALTHAVALGAFAVLSDRGESSRQMAEAPLGVFFAGGNRSAQGSQRALKAANTEAPVARSEARTTAAPDSQPKVSLGQSGLTEGEAKPVGEIRPEYPPLSRRLGEEGEVVFQLTIRADGSVADLQMERSSGFPRLDAAAVAALRGARFEATDIGSSTATRHFHIEFRLRR